MAATIAAYPGGMNEEPTLRDLMHAITRVVLKTEDNGTGILALSDKIEEQGRLLRHEIGRLERRIDDNSTAIVHLHEFVCEGFARFERRFEQVDVRFERLEFHMNRRFDAVDVRFDAFERRLFRLEQRESA